MLKDLHRPLYHADPEYHASFAWCLTDVDSARSPSVSPKVDISPGELAEDDTSSEVLKPVREPIPHRVIAELHTAFERRILDAMPTTGWLITEVMLRTGKDITRIPL